MNGSGTMFPTNGSQSTFSENLIFEQVDPSAEDEDSDSDTYNQINTGQHGFQQTPINTGLKPGKKTKGRVKIKMEFIENKLRRYTTFSKRKTGIMKKAYELSTLTGTQVMLLVASETGHVYTFATRKLQPIITSESGKALIQTCLNSPDPALGTTTGNVLEQRMNPSGFEETDLSCSVGEEEQAAKAGEQVFPGQTPPNPSPLVQTPIITAPKPITVREVAATLPTTQSVNQPVTVSQTPQGQGGLKASLSQVVSALHNQHAVSSSQTNQSGELNTPLPAGTPSAINIMQGQQIITIPVPVSLSGTPLLQLAPPPSAESPKMGPPPIKKTKK
ncbi:serum response factor [Elysia marginata]|uniref:Serum response factor n=1 Tax=Elysia marginata TaxID=1093978 RepID=A0AAV4G2S9_9GAST|nr:serum response factor [Elysia marginata]